MIDNMLPRNLDDIYGPGAENADDGIEDEMDDDGPFLSIALDDWQARLAREDALWTALNNMLSDYEAQYGEGYCECDRSVDLMCNACRARAALGLV